MSAPPPRRVLILTAEHGGNHVPAAYRDLFADHHELLAGHRGWDPGSLELARTLASAAGAPLVAATVSRLVVELNRSVGHRRLFSEVTRTLPAPVQREILERHYFPHRRRVEERIEAVIAGGGLALHLGIHTFTPVLDGEVRRADVGLLYDPGRGGERALADELRRTLKAARPDLRVRRNYPYLGRDDGLTTTLRQRWDDRHYLGLEVEVNQRWPLGEPGPWRRLVADLVAAWLPVLGSGDDFSRTRPEVRASASRRSAAGPATGTP